MVIEHNNVFLWNQFDLGLVIDVPHQIKLISDKPYMVPLRKHLYTDRNNTTITEKMMPFIDLGVYRPAPPQNGPYKAQLVIDRKSGKDRVAHDYRLINDVQILDPYPMTTRVMQIIIHRKRHSQLLRV